MQISPEAFKTLIANIKAEEGLKQVLYLDSTNHYTYGYGHKASIPISEHICEAILIDDLTNAEDELSKNWEPYFLLDCSRKTVLVDMTLNLGITGLMHFRNMLQAIQDQNWKKASAELINSKADHQEPNRIEKWAYKLEFGLI